MFLFEKRQKLENVLRHAPVMSSEKIMEALAVPPETPIVQAVLNVLAGLEEVAKEQTAIPKLPDSERAYYAGGIGSLAEAQLRIDEIITEANKRKRGEKT
jgi:hypothetical protein